ncbi:restriction endonuclease subunit S [Conexibacter sp. CPCC 205706]|nr:MULTISPECIES: restriction endonuclease subunit S [unclassified Conexibacter]MDO8184770.1 restriction endonuclease subunit S [Conexibacter sp. CPCC 205706]
MKVRLPPLEAQTQIIAILGSIDGKIQSNVRLIDAYSLALDRVHDHAIIDADQVSLGDLGEISGGGTPKTSVAEYWQPPDVPWLTPKDMTALRGVPCVWSGERGISRSGLARSSAKLLPAGTVLYTSRATLGIIAIAQQPLATNQGFISIVPRPRLSSSFVYSTLMRCRNRINARAGGSTFPEVNKTNFKGVECSLPGPAALKAHDAMAEPIITHIAALACESRTLTKIRHALLAKLVSGQLRVPLSNDPEEQVGAAIEALA